MSKEEYDVLLWVAENYTAEFNLTAVLLMASTTTIFFLSYFANKLREYILYRFDVDFWTNTLSV